MTDIASAKQNGTVFYLPIQGIVFANYHVLLTSHLTDVLATAQWPRSRWAYLWDQVGCSGPGPAKRWCASSKLGRCCAGCFRACTNTTGAGAGAGARASGRCGRAAAGLYGSGFFCLAEVEASSFKEGSWPFLVSSIFVTPPISISSTVPNIPSASARQHTDSTTRTCLFFLTSTKRVFYVTSCTFKSRSSSQSAFCLSSSFVLLFHKFAIHLLVSCTTWLYFQTNEVTSGSDSFDVNTS